MSASTQHFPPMPTPSYKGVDQGQQHLILSASEQRIPGFTKTKFKLNMAGIDMNDDYNIINK